MPARRKPLPRRAVPMQRTPIKRTTALQSSPRRPVLSAPVAVAKPKRPKDTGPGTAARGKVRRRSGGGCELGLPGCGRQAHHASHRLGKKAGGRHGEMAVRINQPAWFLDACPHCHGLVTSAKEPKLTAYRGAGLLLKEGQDARQRPVQVSWWPVPVLLDDDGGWTVYVLTDTGVDATPHSDGGS